MNTFGNIYTLTTFGESHGPALGGVIDGIPSGFAIDTDAVRQEMARRRPGQSQLVTARNEADEIEFLSGIMDGVTLGTPIGFVIRNTQQHSADYDEMQHIYRPGHADYTYSFKYGIRDWRGGGRASARETAARVVAGALAKQILATIGITISGRLASVGGVPNIAKGKDELSADVQNVIATAKSAGDSVGGIVECVVSGVPAGLGEPHAGKLQALLASAMMSIPAAKGFEYGMGFAGGERHGTEVVDNWIPDAADVRGIRAAANHSGGIQGGISNGEDIDFRVAFKPTATLLRDVQTVNDEHNSTVLHARGRHDPCVAVRAVPVVEAMAAMTILDAFLLAKTSGPIK